MDEIVDFNQLKLLPDICSYCQRPFTETNIRTFDHIIPRSKLKVNRNSRGITILPNLLICCKECNHNKANKSLIQWKQSLHKYMISNDRTERRILRKNIENSINILLTN